MLVSDAARWRMDRPNRNGLMTQTRCVPFQQRREGCFIDWTLSTWVTNVNDSFHSVIHSLGKVRTESRPGHKPHLQFNKTFCFGALDYWRCFLLLCIGKFYIYNKSLYNFFSLHFYLTRRQCGIKDKLPTSTSCYSNQLIPSTLFLNYMHIFTIEHQIKLN